MPSLRKLLKNRPTRAFIFPAYGAWGQDKSIFKTTKQRMESETREETEPVDKQHHRKVYFEKLYMEEMLKAKNMRMVKK